jgi:hypothetical protein
VTIEEVLPWLVMQVMMKFTQQLPLVGASIRSNVKQSKLKSAKCVTHMGATVNVRSPSQLRTIDNLQRVLGWDAAQLTNFLAERTSRYHPADTPAGIDLFIEQLRRLFDDQQRDEGPINKGQYDVIQRVATSTQTDIAAAIRQYLNLDVPLAELTYGEATQLISMLRTERPRTRKTDRTFLPACNGNRVSFATVKDDDINRRGGLKCVQFVAHSIGSK